MNSLMKKLTEEIEKNAGQFPQPKGDKPKAANEKNSGGKGFPPKKENGPGDTKNQGGNNDKKENGKVSESGKKSEGEKKETPPFGKGNEGKNPEANGPNNGNGKDGNAETGNAQQDAGNVNNQGGAGPGTGSTDITAIIDFFAQNPTPDDNSFHQFAEQQGFDVHQAESMAYALAGKYVMFLRGGDSGNKKIDMSQIDPEQLDKGIQSELEHTSDIITAKKISIDHLSTMPDYYSRLEQMESGSEQVVAEPKQEQRNQKQEQTDKKQEQPNKKQDQFNQKK